MGVFKDEAEVHKYIGGVFEKGLADPQIGPKLSGSGVILQITYTDPDAVVTVDMPNGKVYAGASDLKPVVELFMTADDGNRFWLGELNLATALAKGKVRAKGPTSKVLKLVPAAKSLFPTYREMLEADGRQDLLAA
ncbi:putative sterol carrier protein [Saccharomonospora marina XMU15]|uniref:Putative sterol carrier protein n=1 Tax=Saccharomonospora marina XMU15 TaxID=882083 RepID=H5X7Z9_9PSEU|nr:SCP2 sterol-binding domain-containing protein [Saccharomonospora marina]EHR53531.1 putative sterol carrier protein [Saccharomonospora marina XMU15]